MMREPNIFASAHRKALIEAAKRESGIQSPTELGILAVASLAQPDPVTSFLKRMHASLGPGQKLDV